VGAFHRLSPYELAAFSSRKANEVATPACRALARRFVETWAVGKKAPPDVDLDAAAAVALYGVAELIGEERDVIHLAHVLVRMTRLRCRRQTASFDDPPRSFSWSWFEETATPHFDHDYDLTTIAEHIAERMGDQREGVRAVLEPARVGAPIATRVLYGVAMEDQEWICEAGRAFTKENKRDHPDSLATTLFHEVADAELLNALAKRFPQDVPLSILERYGAAVTPAAIAHHSWDTNDLHATRALARFENVAAARQLAKSLPKARAGAIAKDYFRAHPDLALEALTPLRDDAQLGIYVRALLDPRPARAPDDGRKPLPEFANPAGLPPLEHTDATDLLHALRASTLAKPSPILASARISEDGARLGAFAKALFEQWLVANAPSLDTWAMQAIGHIGDDASARDLATHIVHWQKKVQKHRARSGVEALAALGTAYALMQLERIGADEALDAIAKKLQLTRAALADRSVPDLGLDARLVARFDFGPRVIEVTVGDDLALTKLPKGKPSDDAAKVALAAQRHKALKDDVKLLYAMQVARLERAMCEQRRWTGADFRTFVMGHPIVAAIATRLVWGVFDGATLTVMFTLAEDGAPMTCDGRPYTLLAGANVGVVHRLEITDEDARAWGEHLAQHEKIPPFDQIGRAVHFRDPADQGFTLGRFSDAALADHGIDGLEAHGWQKIGKQLRKGMSVIELALGPPRIHRVAAGPDLSKIGFSELVREITDVIAV
jgi:hypothetical protein